MGSPTQADVTGVAVLFLVLAILSFGVRIFSNRTYQKTIEIDDALILPSFLLVLTAAVAVIYGSESHLVGGHSLPAISPKKYTKINKFEYALWMGHVLAIDLIKLSILFFFRRLFKGRTKRTAFDVVNWTLISLVACWTITFLLTIAFSCGPTPQALWTTVFWTGHTCFDTSAMYLACAALDWIFDLAILIEPLVMISTLHLSLRKKLELCSVFLLSFLAVIAALLRMVIWIGVYNHGTTTVTILGETLPVVDLQAAVTYGVFWTYIELGVGFMVACLLPAARFLDAMAISSKSAVSRMKSLASSIWSRFNRNDPTVPGKDAQSDEMRPSDGRPQKTSMHHYSREMASINQIPSIAVASGEHHDMGNFTTVSGPKERAEQTV